MSDDASSTRRLKHHFPARASRTTSDPALEPYGRRARLERWAALFDRNPYQLIGLLRPSWASGREVIPMVSNPSAIDIAWADPVFRVTGLKGRSRGAMKAFFGLSDAQFDRIASGSCRVPLRPAWQVAARIRNVADPRLKRPLLISILVIIAVFIGIVQGLG